jgi:hypothetical protein
MQTLTLTFFSPNIGPPLPLPFMTSRLRPRPRMGSGSDDEEPALYDGLAAGDEGAGTVGFPTSNSGTIASGCSLPQQGTHYVINF